MKKPLHTFHDKVVLFLTYVGYNNKLITSTPNTEFLANVIENSLSWKAHVYQLTLNLCAACYAVRAIKLFVLLDSPKVVYYSYFHSFMNYGIIFWGHLSHSVPAFILQKKSNELSPDLDLETLAENY
jgi:hypothetical protein